MASGSMVLLCECSHVGEAQLLASALEARGITVHCQGMHTQAVLGGLYGGAHRTRVLVPHAQLADARAFAAEIVGPFDEPGREHEAPSRGDPLRPRPLVEDDLPEPLDDEASSDDEGASSLSAVDDDDDDDDDLAAATVRPRSIVVVVLLALFGLNLLGLAQIYVGRGRRGAVVFAGAAMAMWLLARGDPSGLALLAAVWCIDVVTAAASVSAFNRALRPAAAAKRVAS
ncbi:MAG: DUF2007 domain-containing protein [Deltaproteobacteria bacterium]|nr:DUF2007 domain-containing protein [Deltaproteobacteria bacterium]MBK8718271.1 DUF2007 domain-containing protein [Deltaproteobacteria bacterium]MBP7291095.1 DUF2007 domain-containing protein [Nannocystaceae bacterium]